MRKPLIVVMIMLLTACYASGLVNQEREVVITKEDAEKGMLLAAESDCLACHKTDEDIIGPSYKAVAKKYRATEKNINMLANRIITGGKGHWSDVPMPPHFDLPVDDAKLMVKYVLSLKKAQ
ncbi:MAG: c-type cytochrome [Chitinophagaceae bacterium]